MEGSKARGQVRCESWKRAAVPDSQKSLYDKSGRNQEAYRNNVIPSQLSPQVLVGKYLEEKEEEDEKKNKGKKKSKMQPWVQMRNRASCPHVLADPHRPSLSKVGFP